MSRDGYAVTAVDMAERTPHVACVGALVAAARHALNIEPGDELTEYEHELLCRTLRAALNATQPEDSHLQAVFMVMNNGDPEYDNTTIARLIESNQDCPITEAKLLALTLCRVADEVPFGGGATPRVTLTRIR